MDKHPGREKVVSYLKSVLYGPQGGKEEVIEGTPFLRYMVGMLFPVGEVVDNGSKIVSAAADDEPRGIIINDEEQDEGLNDVMNMAFEALPSAVGISFRVPGNSQITCHAWGAIYKKQGDEKPKVRATQRWKREALATPERPSTLELHEDFVQAEIFGGLGRIVQRWRHQPDGSAIVTVTLVNEQATKGRGLNPEKTLFQVGLKCESHDNLFLPYDEEIKHHLPGSEEEEAGFLYKESMPFARGHGAAATWEQPVSNRSRWVSIDFMPAVDVPYPDFEIIARNIDRRCFQLDFLGKAPREDVVRALKTLVIAYEEWIKEQREKAKQSLSKEIAKRLVERAYTFLLRMEEGINLLSRNDVAWKSFRYANLAMGWQMGLSSNLRKGPYKVADQSRIPVPGLENLKWRPFQVAFFLSVIDSLLNPESSDRDTVDIIWFPTGGGKTEAYMLVTAFELIRRRLVDGEKDTGTAVFSRYTLRLLTSDQFQRTGALVAALELIRARNPLELGSRPFSLGLWVGEGLTPNTFRKAYEKYMEQVEGKTPKNPFPLEACPCCGTEIFPANPVPVGKNWRQSDFGIVSSQDTFYFRCPNMQCEFQEKIPLNIVDEALYKDPPSMILGTIDKFAMLPWDDRARVFFGGPKDDSIPPSLVIQDELHLISGPLGSLAAPYDAAIDAIIKVRGRTPKRIGATATIRNAAEQVRGLYGRKVAIFPSPCGYWDNAFFFTTKRKSAGRQYVGVMGQGYTKSVVALAWTLAALLQSVKEVQLDHDSLDAYWTVMAYHNSRRELGRTLTAARDEVAARIKTIATSPAKVRKVGEPLELSAQMVKSMSEALGELRRSNTPNYAAVDLVPCTSIISVGVDVTRLGVMLVNGQPKLTSEYIQATSRIGRGKIPGLVVTLFSPSKPRDRSHYEDFRAYHEAIYRYVEPTSVTPYAIPARQRTFHAALVTLVRHALEWRAYDKAGSVDFENLQTRKAVETLLEVMYASDPTEKEALEKFAKERINEWIEFAESNQPLLYENRKAGMQFAGLLYRYGHVPASCLWPTMMSVRNVDEEAIIEVI